MFEDLKNRVRRIEAPGTESHQAESIESLFDKVRIQDQKDKKMFKGTYIMFTIMLVLYTLIFVINPDPDLGILNRIAGGFFIISFGIMIPIMQSNYYERKGVDYNASTLDFLNKAENRLKFWNRKSWWIVPFLLFIAVAENLALFNVSWLSFMDPATRILTINLTYWGIMAVGYLVARMKWRKEKSHLLVGIRDLKNEFTS